MIYPLLQPTPTTPPDTTTQWVLIGAGLVLILFMVFRPSLRRKDPLAKGPPASLAQQRAVEREMQNLLVELSEMARQISAQLDTRAAKLDLLIREADAKIAEMNRLSVSGNGRPDASSGNSPPTEPTDANRASSAEEHASSSNAATDPRHAQVYELADQGQNVAQIANQLGRPSGEIELILALRPKRS